MEKLFLLEIHHSGHLDHHNMVYVNGTVDYVENVHRDTMSMIEFHGLLAELGIGCSECKMWHKMQVGPEDAGLVLLNSDESVIEMFDGNEKSDTIIVMVEKDQPEWVGGADGIPVGSDARLRMYGDQEDAEGEEGGGGELGVYGNGCDVGDDGDDLVNTDSDDSNAPVHDHGELDVRIADDDDSLYQGQVDAARKISVQIDSTGPERGQIEGCIVTELYDDDSGSGEDIDRHDLTCGNIQDLHSSSDDEHDTNASRSMKFCPIEIEKPTLSLGMGFTSLSALREALKQVNIASGHDLIFLKSDKQRVLAVCRARSCPYRIYASWSLKEKSFLIKAFNSIHTCSARKTRNSLATSAWLAKTYFDMIRDDPHWKASSLVNSVKRDFSVCISKAQAYRARVKVFELIEAEQEEQCTRLPDYADILKIKMPETVVKLHLGGSPHEALNDGCRAYRRAFICFEPIKRGFLIGCRPFLGLDGFHLKRPCKGHLLNAVGMDGNGEIFPLAFAWVEAETKESWTWFLTILSETIGSAKGNGWTFISDHQNGLLETVAEVMPAAEHRLCASHVHKNFEKKFKGAMCSLFWEAASSYTILQFENAMANIRKEVPHGEDAHNWLRGRHTRLWSRSSFHPFSKCDMFVNSPCDDWEKRILWSSKPIISIFESIRKWLMRRNQRKRLSLKSYDGAICPKVMSKLESVEQEASMCEVIGAGDRNFEVNYKGRAYVVDLTKNDCGCGEWDLSGVPCIHAVASMLSCNEKPSDFIHEYYHRSTYMKAYEPVMMPIPDSSQWPVGEFKSIDSPGYNKPPDEPAQPCEEEPASAVRWTRCGICKIAGHNARTCGKPPQGTERTGKNCRKRKERPSKMRAASNSIARTIRKRRKKLEMGGTSEVIPASDSYTSMQNSTAEQSKRYRIGETSGVGTGTGSAIAQSEAPRRIVSRGKWITRAALRSFRSNPGTSSNIEDPIIID